MIKTQLLTLVLITSSVLLNAQSDLLITPFRVVLENGKTVEEISVANTGNDTARYSLSFVQYAMDADGTLRQIEAPEEGIMFADRYLRIFPRSVVLAPKEAQIVRLQARLPSDLATGEYRSHLYFRSTSNQQAIGFETGGEDGLGVELIPVYGITIPVIVRLGSEEVNVKLTDARFEKGEEVKISLNIERDGDYSVYGDLEVIHTSNDGTQTIIALMRGVGVYTPLKARSMKIPLNKALEIPQGGEIKIVYSSKKNGQTVVLGETKITL